jgi:sugar fermentation stimulation protein A
MKYKSPLIPVKILNRYKRFLADVQFEDGRIETVFCPNTGKMTSCWGKGWDAMVSPQPGSHRKYAYSLELCRHSTGWVCVNTHLANRVVYEALQSRELDSFSTYLQINREPRINDHTRLDFELNSGSDRCFIEVKMVTLLKEGCYQFPDAVTLRGQKHLRELQKLVKLGCRSVLFFLVPRSGGTQFMPARTIDPVYAEQLVACQRLGVEIVAYQAEVSPNGIFLGTEIEVNL